MINKSSLTGAKARRERIREEMRTAIVDSATRMVTEHGIEGLTIRGVAQDLGYSPGALYEYFDSKDALVCALYFEGTDGLGVHCERAIEDLPASTTALQRIEDLGRAYRAFALTHPELYRLAFFNFKSPPEQPVVDAPEEEAGGFGVTVEVIQQGIDAGELIDDLPAAAIGMALWSAVHGFVSLELAGHITGSVAPGMPPPPDEEARRHRDQLFEVVLRMALHGFARQEVHAAAGS